MTEYTLTASSFCGIWSVEVLGYKVGDGIAMSHSPPYRAYGFSQEQAQKRVFAKIDRQNYRPPEYKVIR